MKTFTYELRRYNSLFEMLEARFLLVKFCQIFMLQDPDPNSQYGSGSRTAKSLRIRIHSTNKNGKDYEPGPLFLQYRTKEYTNMTMIVFSR